MRGMPEVNCRTLRRLVGHLRTIGDKHDKNLMPTNNLAAIWGPTLLTVDGLTALDFAQTTGEADVCKDLLDNYSVLFDVTAEEIQLEEEIMKKTENFNRNPMPKKLTGEETACNLEMDFARDPQLILIILKPKQKEPFVFLF